MNHDLYLDITDTLKTNYRSYQSDIRRKLSSGALSRKSVFRQSRDENSDKFNAFNNVMESALEKVNKINNLGLNFDSHTFTVRDATTLEYINNNYSHICDVLETTNALLDIEPDRYLKKADSNRHNRAIWAGKVADLYPSSFVAYIRRLDKLNQKIQDEYGNNFNALKYQEGFF